ncbi:MFS general substrate transporter [Aureobasidium sp. EXF-12298]|nr:MFS general substrate transporter [Aureobasidium sp. EXF-12298]
MAGRTGASRRSNESESLPGDKEATQHIEQVQTRDSERGHAGYLEKDGLRIDNDEQDHYTEPPMSFKRMMSLIAMAFLWTGSQIPVYLFGGIPPYIYADIGGADRWIWLVLANLLSLAAVCPFVGSLSDIFGRRYVALIGAALIVVGMVICTTAHSMNVFIGGMVFAGVGAGINELTALAATSELAPTAKRVKYVAILIFSILPFCPSVLWGQLIAANSSWRWVGALCAIWAFIGQTVANCLIVVLTAVFYFPPPRVNSQGLSKAEILKQVDYVGGLLSVSGMILFMAGMQWGGYQYSWDSAHVLAPLILGAILLIAFGFWETYGAKYPMFPKRLRQEPRILSLTLVITFISGANFFSLLMFWPTQSFGVGIRGLPVGFSILAGACIVLWLLSVFRGHNKALMIVSSILMTAGCGALSVARLDNLGQLWGILVVAGLGIGGIVVPASIITTIICPDDLIATVAALTLAIRVIGGSIGYCVYFNVFLNKFVPAATHYIGGTMIYKLNITSPVIIKTAIELTSASLLTELETLPGIKGVPGAYEMVVFAGRLAYAEAYKYVYYVSIAFGAVSIIAACFLGDINKYMDDHIAVVLH